MHKELYNLRDKIIRIYLNEAYRIENERDIFELKSTIRMKEQE